MTSTVEFEDRTPENLKIAPITDRAFRLWFNATCYCARNLTDGRIPAVLILKLSRTATGRVVDELLNARLFEQLDEQTFLVHDYLAHNPSRAEVANDRRRTRERVASWRDRHRTPDDPTGNGDVTDYKQRTSAAGNAVRNSTKPISDKKRVNSELEKASEETLLVVDSLAAQIVGRDPQAGVSPRSEAWLREARLLLEKDGRSIEQVAAVLDWLPTDDFWPTVILSTTKLRARFTQLVAKMQAAQNGGSRRGHQSPSDLLRKLAASEAGS